MKKVAIRKPTPEQKRALQSFLKGVRTKPGNSEGEHRWTRDELHKRNSRRLI